MAGRERHPCVRCIHPSERGFSLAETIAALVLVAAAVMLLATTASSGWRGLRQAEHADRTIELARALIETVGAERQLAPGRSEGSESDGTRWAIDIEPYQPPAPMPARVRAQAYRVTVVASGGRGGPATRLSTIKLGAAP